MRLPAGNVKPISGMALLLQLVVKLAGRALLRLSPLPKARSAFAVRHATDGVSAFHAAASFSIIPFGLGVVNRE